MRLNDDDDDVLATLTDTFAFSRFDHRWRGNVLNGFLRDVSFFLTWIDVRTWPNSSTPQIFFPLAILWIDGHSSIRGVVEVKDWKCLTWHRIVIGDRFGGIFFINIYVSSINSKCVWAWDRRNNCMLENEYKNKCVLEI